MWANVKSFMKTEERKMKPQSAQRKEQISEK
jgi:hypothetical protein